MSGKLVTFDACITFMSYIYTQVHWYSVRRPYKPFGLKKKIIFVPLCCETVKSIHAM